MGCLTLVGLLLVAAGFSQGWEGASAVFSGLMVLAFAWSLRPHESRKIDSSVNNRIIAYDGNGRYLVSARTSRQITGPRSHVEGNLPAHLTEIRKGFWVVDTNPQACSAISYRSIPWVNIEDKNLSIEPRGNTCTNGYLADIIEGWEHNYIRENES